MNYRIELQMVELSKIIGIILIASVAGDDETWNNNSSCETSVIRINTSYSGNPDDMNNEVWCPTFNEPCYRQLDNIFNFWIGSVMHDTIGFTGILMNIVFCYVLSRKELRTVFNCLLIALAIFDSLLLMLRIIETFRRQYQLTTQVHIFLFPKVLYPLSSVTLCISIYMVVAISMERYIAVTRPISLHLEMENSKRAQVKRFLKYLLPVVLFSILFNIPKFFDVHSKHNDETERLEFHMTKFRLHPDYMIYYIGVAQLIVTVIIPFVTIIYLNASTYLIIYRRQKNQSVMNQTNENTLEMETLETHLTESGNNAALRTHLAPKQRRPALEERLYLLFMTISILFLLCHLPRSILYFYEALYAKELIACWNAVFTGFGVPLWVLQLAQISYVFLAINSSVHELNQEELCHHIACSNK